MRKYTWIVVIVLMLSFPASALADTDTALKTVQQQVDQVLKVIKSDDSKAQKKELISKQAKGFFDFTLMARLALGYHWKKMSPDQQEQFTKVYRDLLESVYMDRLLSYKGQKINYVRQIQLSDTRAQVDTQVVTPQGQEIPMAYRLVDENGQWRVYDMVIENVSLAQNYRSQFTSFLQNKSYNDLLEQLRQKTEKTG